MIRWMIQVIWVVTLDVNGLNALAKISKSEDWIKKHDPIMGYL